jgi:hypothetical protein
MWWAVLDSRTKIKWVIFTVLIPELIIGKALNDLLAAKNLPGTSKFNLVWDEVHAHMANMRYFVVDFGQYWLEANESDEDRGEVKVEQEGYERLRHWLYDLDDSETFELKIAQADYSLRTMVRQALLDGSQGEDLPMSAGINLSRMTHRYWAPSGRQLSLLVPHIIDLPTVHARQLEVLNRGDALVKVLALVQIPYLLIQLITRKIVGLPLTQLEIGALAFSASSIITYIIYWNKPQGIESIQIIQPKCAPSRRRVIQMALVGPRYIWTNHRAEWESEKLYDVATIPNDAMNYLFPLISGVQLCGHNDEILVVAVGALRGGTLFGGLHCLGICTSLHEERR